MNAGRACGCNHHVRWSVFSCALLVEYVRCGSEAQAARRALQAIHGRCGWDGFGQTCCPCPALLPPQVVRSAAAYSAAARTEVSILEHIRDSAAGTGGCRHCCCCLRGSVGQVSCAHAGLLKLPLLAPCAVPCVLCFSLRDAPLHALPAHQTGHDGAAHCVRLLDTFPHTGPHGTHVCEVFEAMGDDLLTLLK